MKTIQSEAKFTFFESTGVIIGHGVGAGILTVPYLVSRNNWWDFIWILLLAFGLNILLHLMIAELSYNNGGAQFVKCLQLSLFGRFSKKAQKVIAIVCFAFLFLSVILNVCSYLAGGSASIADLLHLFNENINLPAWAGMLIFFVFGALVVYFGMKIVGISEKYTVFLMLAVMLVLTVTTFIFPLQSLPTNHETFSKTIINMLALYGVISFALSSVMSVPTVVKGLQGNIKKIRLSVICGTFINVCLIALLTFVTLLGVGKDNISEDGALVDLANSLMLKDNVVWVGVMAHIFSIFALLTSFWANTLNLRDIIAETASLNKKLCWLIASLPGLILALIFSAISFTSFGMIAGGIQVITGVAIILAYHFSRKQAFEDYQKADVKIEKDPLGPYPIIGKYGAVVFQVIVICSSLLASVGTIVKSFVK